MEYAGGGRETTDRLDLVPTAFDAHATAVWGFQHRPERYPMDSYRLWDNAENAILENQSCQRGLDLGHEVHHQLTGERVYEASLRLLECMSRDGFTP